MKKTDQGILLNRINYSESSLILSYFTLENGLKKFIYQGAKKKGQQFFPLVMHEITFYERPDSELSKLTQTSILNAHFDYQFNPIKSTIAYFIAEVCLKSMHEAKDVDMYTFIENQLQALNNQQDVSILPLLFLIKLSAELGFQPLLLEGEKPLYFDLEEGVFTDKKPIRHYFGRDCVSQELFKSFMDENYLPHLNTIDKKEAFKLMIIYFEIHVPSFKPGKTLQIIHEILY
jgi:DNA repair protein RecO (recombination protein O)